MKKQVTGLYTTLYTFRLSERERMLKRAEAAEAKGCTVKEVFVNNGLAIEVTRPRIVINFD